MKAAQKSHSVKLRAGTCQTCRNGDARYAARHETTRELWRICETCARQARRLNAPITFEALI